MIPRSVNNIIDSIRSSLQDIRSPLANFSPYSNVYALLRTISIAVAESDVNISNLSKSFYINSASGEALDLRVSDMGMLRYTGSFAEGHVLVSGPSSVIQDGTVLSTPDQLYQFETTETIYINNETKIGIKALNVGSASNLNAGIRLFSLSYPNTKFIVGSYRDPLTKEPIGNMSGGLDRESDLELRGRAFYYLRGLAASNMYSIENTIRAITPNRFYIKEHTPTTGYISIYVDSKNLRTIQQIEEAVKTVKAVGVSYAVKPILIHKESVSLILTLTPSNSFDAVINKVKQDINLYSNSLGLGGVISRSVISGIAMNHPQVVNCQVIQPNQDVEVRPDTLASIDSIYIDLRVKQ